MLLLGGSRVATGCVRGEGENPARGGIKGGSKGIGQRVDLLTWRTGKKIRAEGRMEKCTDSRFMRIQGGSAGRRLEARSRERVT